MKNIRSSFARFIFAYWCLISAPAFAADIELIGDSLVATQVPGGAVTYRGWGQYIGDYLPQGLTLVNSALGGESSKSFYELGHWARVAVRQSSYVLIQFGHNDTPISGVARATVPGTTFKAFLQRYIDETRAWGGTPVLVSPPPRRALKPDGSVDTTVITNSPDSDLQLYRDAMQEVAVANQVAFIDLFTFWKALFEQVRLSGSLGWFDGKTHLFEPGARMFARFVAGELLQQVPALRIRGNAPFLTPPVAMPDTATASGTGNAIFIRVLDNDADADGNALRLVGVGVPTQGAAVAHGGGVIFHAPLGFSGTAEFSYSVDDWLGQTATTQVVVTAGVVVGPATNVQPVANPDIVSVTRNGTAALDVMGNDSDANGDALSLLSVGLGSHGTTSIADGKVVYTPATDYLGSDYFSYTISDGRGGAAIGNVTVSVFDSANHAPTAQPDVFITALLPKMRIYPLVNDTDEDNDVLVISNVVSPTAFGMVGIINGNQLLYRPGAGFAGYDEIVYTVSDSRGGLSTTTVRVEPNVAPVAVADSAVATLGSTVLIPVLANDSDINGDTLVIDSIVRNQKATLVIVGASVSYKPAANFVGTDFFTYTVRDGRGGLATARVTITGENAVPVARDDSATLMPNGTALVPVLANDADADGDALTVTAVSLPSSGTATITAAGVAYQAGLTFNLADEFTYTISDGRGGTATAIVRIAGPAVNAVPVANEDSGTVVAGGSVVLDVLANDADANGDALTVTAVSLPSSGTATITAAGVAYQAGLTFNLADEFTYTISDGRGGTATAIVRIAGPAVNAAPVANEDSATVVAGGSVVLDVLANDADADGDAVLLISVGAATHGVTEVEGSMVRYTPSAAFIGREVFSYSISDGRQTSTGMVAISVTPANQEPVAHPDVAYILADDVAVIAVLANDTDADGDAVSLTNVGAATHGRTAVVGSQATYTPDDGFAGDDSFFYRIADGRGGGATGVVTVTVRPLVTLSADGTYETMIRNDASEVEGCVRATVTTIGAVSGTLKLGTNSYSWTGAIDASLSLATTVDTARGTSILTLHFVPNAAAESLLITGTFAIPGQTPWVLDGAEKFATDGLGALVGKYTVSLASISLNGPGGCGWFTFTSDRTGGLVATGKASDGTVIAGATNVRRDGSAVLYFPLYAGGGYLSGRLHFRPTVTSDCDGEFEWKKPTRPSGLYPSGFAVSLAAEGSLFTPRQAGVQTLVYSTPDAASAEFHIFGGNFEVTPISRLFAVSTNDIATQSPATVDAPIVTLTRKNGVVSGRFIDPITPSMNRNFSGVMLQKSNRACGFQIGSTLSGNFEWLPL